MIAKRCKVLNIITDNVRKFEYVEKLLNEEYGVMVNITGNIEKSSKRADVIFNFDFVKDELDKCNMKKNSILVQMNREEYIRKDGIVIRFFKLNLPIRYDEKFARFNHFNEEILYESIVYYKNSFKNIMAILRRDNVNIKYFIGSMKIFNLFIRYCLKFIIYFNTNIFKFIYTIHHIFPSCC